MKATQTSGDSLSHPIDAAESREFAAIKQARPKSEPDRTWS